jgi:ABC-type transport system substrate-binding protein
MQFTVFVLRPDGNASRFEFSEYRGLVDVARAESDWTLRIELCRAIARMLKEEAFLLPIANSVTLWGGRETVRGVTRQPLVGDPVPAEPWMA